MVIAEPLARVSACDGCGVEVTSLPGVKRRKWCSDSCRVRTFYERNPDRLTARRARRRRDRCAVYFEPCDVCGKLRAWRYRRQVARACSPDCERAANAARARREYVEHADRVRQRRSALRRSDPAMFRRIADRRRAALVGVEAEDFDRVEIFERDGWTCGLCRRPIDRWRSMPDVMAASLDHVIPLSLGGSHTRRNSRASHFGCNARRGNRLGVKF